MRWLKQHIKLLSIIGVITIMLFSYYNNQYYAHRVITAIENDDVDSVRKLMKSSFGNLNHIPTFWIIEVIGEESKPTPLQAACKLGNPEIVKLLLDNGADVNYVYWDKARDSGSPLQNAASSLSENRLQVIKLLIGHGADVGYESYTGNDAMSCAVYASFDREDAIAVIEYLENSGMDVFKKYGATQNTLLHKACENDSRTIIRYLVEKRGFDVNLANADGDTALIYFVRFASNRSEDTLKFLIESGANLEAVNKEGKTAYDYSIERHPNFSYLLKP